MKCDKNETKLHRDTCHHGREREGGRKIIIIKIIMIIVIIVK
jgi:hypothetical protein